VKKTAFLLALVALAACSGDSTGSQPTLAGQWLFRMRATTTGDTPVGCQVVGTVRLAGSGSTFTGRMPMPETSCTSIHGALPTFDSTTTLSARLKGDSVFMTLRAGDYEIQQAGLLLGDSIAGAATGSATGTMAARRFAESIPLDRVPVRLTGAVARNTELYGRGAWNGLILVQPGTGEAIFLLPSTGTQALLATGTYTVGGATAQLHGYYQLFANGKADPYVQFTGGTVTVTQADAQLVRGTFDVTGVLNGGPDEVRLQSEFTMHRSGYPDGSL
jgi:hypothetical protein